METEKLVSITIAIPKRYRDHMRKIVAQTNLRNPEEVATLSKLGRKIFCQYLKHLTNDEGLNRPSHNDNLK